MPRPGRRRAKREGPALSPLPSPPRRARLPTLAAGRLRGGPPEPIAAARRAGGGGRRRAHNRGGVGSGAGRGAGGEPGSTLRRAEGESRRAGEGGFPRLFCNREVRAGAERTGSFFFSPSLPPFFLNFVLEGATEPAFPLLTSPSCLPAPASPAHSFNKGSCSQPSGFASRESFGAASLASRR